MKTVTARFRVGDRKARELTRELKLLTGLLQIPARQASIRTSDGEPPTPNATEVTRVLGMVAFTLNAFESPQDAAWKGNGHARRARQAVNRLLKNFRRAVF